MSTSDVIYDLTSTGYGISGNLAILPNCNAEDRCKKWVGALNGITGIGCGVNILRFIGEIDDTDANVALKQATCNGEGTPFQDIVNWFNLKLKNMGIKKIHLEEFKVLIDGRDKVERLFAMFNHELLPNTCVIVKLNRVDNQSLLERKGLTPGHYILLSKDAKNHMWTYEPYLSTKNDCFTRQYKGVISDNFYASYRKNLYDSASYLIVVHNPETTFGGMNQHIKIPKKIFLNFKNSLLKSLKKFKRTNKNIQNKRKYKNTYKKR